LTLPRIFVAIPLMDEKACIHNLLADLTAQLYPASRICVCVNQPDHWWDLPQKREICISNREVLDLLHHVRELPLHLIDRSGRGNGWKGRQHGVGWSRKLAMDACAAVAGTGDIILSLDGDTRFKPGYFESVAQAFLDRKPAVALAVPYYHPLTGDETTDRAILHYEIYMRYYSLNLWRIGSPYAFTALGSAMAVRISAYRAIRGITPLLSGEDFYFLQKLRKHGEMMRWCPEKVYPAARFSDRVFFGTGPAMIKGRAGDWSSYPLYHYRLFDQVAETASRFPLLFHQSIPTPMDAFLKKIFREQDIFTPLRKNNTDEARFIRACHGKIDGLRILQYLKSEHRNGNVNDGNNLRDFLLTHYPHTEIPSQVVDAGNDLFKRSVCELDQLRNYLEGLETQHQMAHFQNLPSC